MEKSDYDESPGRLVIDLPEVDDRPCSTTPASTTTPTTSNPPDMENLHSNCRHNGAGLGYARRRLLWALGTAGNQTSHTKTVQASCSETAQSVSRIANAGGFLPLAPNGVGSHAVNIRQPPSSTRSPCVLMAHPKHQREIDPSVLHNSPPGGRITALPSCRMESPSQKLPHRSPTNIAVNHMKPYVRFPPSATVGQNSALPSVATQQTYLSYYNPHANCHITPLSPTSLKNPHSRPLLPAQNGAQRIPRKQREYHRNQERENSVFNRRGEPYKQRYILVPTKKSDGNRSRGHIRHRARDGEIFTTCTTSRGCSPLSSSLSVPNYNMSSGATPPEATSSAASRGRSPPHGGDSVPACVSSAKKKGHLLAAALEELRAAIPAHLHPERLSKLNTLRLAASYIHNLSQLAHGDHLLNTHRLAASYIHNLSQFSHGDH